jgi:hypothetical protein
MTMGEAMDNNRDDDPANFDDILDLLITESNVVDGAKKLRMEHPYVLYLIKVLYPYGARGLRRMDVIYRIEQMRIAANLPMPRAFEATIQASYNAHTSHSKVFRGPPEDDLFYPVRGKGSGIWAVHADKIGAWLAKKKLEALP